MIDLKAKPFYLSDDDIKWVEETLAGLTLEEKVAQLFCPVGFTDDENALKQMTGVGIGGIMYRPSPSIEMQKTHRFLQENSKIPMLLSANLEDGGSGIALDGTKYGKPLQAAATNDKDAGYKLGKIACSEGAAVGCNWSFAPIVDIDFNFRNPITNLRTFGSNVDKVIEMGKGYMKAADEENLAVSIKHFPGDGVDERDQHLVVSINSLSTDEWDKTYGRVYQELIDEGAKTVMVGHIAQPAYAHKLNPEIPANNNIPATLSKELLTGLLREKLGFNGMIVTDASPMVGFCASMERKKAVPYSIEAGNDMFLFNKSFEEDFGYMIAGYHEGILSDNRLEEAVTRILGLKASLKLHTKKSDGTIVPQESALDIIGCEKHLTWAKECSDESVTLVKDTQNLLPISPEKHKRVYLNILEQNNDVDSPTRTMWKELFEKEGFEVTVQKRIMGVDLGAVATGEITPELITIMGEMMGGAERFRSLYDIAIYISNFETASNNTAVRLNWGGIGGMGDDTPWFVKEVPTLFISTANPYHLLDVSMIQTYINSYTSNDVTNKAVIEKLLGRSEFKGVSPVDAFCGREDTKL